MLTIHNEGMKWQGGRLVPAAKDESGVRATMAWSVLQAHNTSGSPDRLSIRFDAMASHDITYVGIIQTARASGMKQFPLPYVLTNCHNSLCAVGGTINEDDHVFGLSAAKKYGGEFVPAHQAVIHSYMRERYAAPGSMILGSDSHTRYGAYGCMAIGEGGPELARQLLQKTYDIAYPPVVAVYLTGAPRPGVGPQDVALALMTTETTCLSSIWQTDEQTKTALTLFGRGDSYRQLSPGEGAWYDRAIVVELDKVEPMIALPFHPSNAYPIRVFKENMADLLHQVEADTREQLGIQPPAPLTDKIVDGQFRVDQAVIAGCSGGTYQNLRRAAEIIGDAQVGSDAFWLSCYPGSMPIMLELTKPPLHPELPQPGGLQAGGWPGVLCGPDGRPVHRRHSEDGGRAHRRRRAARRARRPSRRAVGL